MHSVIEACVCGSIPIYDSNKPGEAFMSVALGLYA